MNKFYYCFGCKTFSVVDPEESWCVACKLYWREKHEGKCNQSDEL